MLIFATFLQVDIDPGPQDVMTLQWIIITALAGVVLLLFRELRKSEQDKSDFKALMMEKTLTGLSEVNGTVAALVSAMQAVQQQFSIMREIDKLRQEMKNDPKKD